MLTVEAVTHAGVRSRAVRAEGTLDRPVLLFLHGFSDSADGWRRVQRRLSKLGYASVAVDQPSHGEADLVDLDAPVIPQFVAFAADAAKMAGDGRPVVVVGNSLGGAHALLLAQHHPDLVQGVVAISPASFDHPSWFGILDEDSRVGRRLRAARERSEARRIDPDPTLDEASRAVGGTPAPLRDRLLRRALVETGFRTLAFGRPWRAPRGFVDDWRTQFRDPVRRRALRELAGRVRDEYLHVDPIDLAAIHQPVLALWGSLDRLVLPSSRRALEAGLGDLTFVELPGVGHMPQLEVPGRTTKHLRDFVERVAPA